MRRLLVLWILLGLPSANLMGQYPWPAAPFDQQHWINGTFCENRPSGALMRHHFHDGVDIHLPQGNAVYSVINGTVTSLSRGGDNAYIRVGRFAYVHVEPNPGLQVGDPVTAFETVIGVTNHRNHIHFKDGYPGSEINSLRPTGLAPFEDLLKPTVARVDFVGHGSEQRFSNGVVTGPVDIVVRAMDTTDHGPLGSNNGVYKIGYEITSADGQTVFEGPRVAFQFDQIPSDEFITNVYAPGSDLSTYYYIVSNELSRPRYWDTSTLAPGEYLVRVFAGDTRANTDTSAVRVVVAEPDLIPPATPLLTEVVGDFNGSFRILWKPNPEADLRGYRLGFTYDGTTWRRRFDEDDLGAADTMATFSNFPVGTDIYFRLTAVDGAPIPNESIASDTYGMQITTARPKALIVDAFDRTDGVWNSPRHDFAFLCGQALSQTGIGFDTVADEAVASAEVDLSNYDLLIYLLGDEVAPDSVLTAAERQRLRQYLQKGGALQVAGAYVAGELSQVDGEFLTDFLGVRFAGEHPGSERILGVAGSPFEGAELNVAGGAYVLAAADVLTPEGAVPVLESESGQVVGTAYRGPVPGGTAAAGILFFTFPLGTLSSDALRAEVMRRSMEFFSLTTSVSELPASARTSELTLLPSTPNPFNQHTQIRYRLERPAEVRLRVYNTAGQLVHDFGWEQQGAGLHAVLWDGRNRQGEPVASGVYFVQLTSGRAQRTGSLVVVR